MKTGLALGVCAFLFLAIPVDGAVIHVSRTTGSNKNPGTAEKPKKLLWKVLAAAKDGDVIKVAQGTYYGRSKSGLMPKLPVGNLTLLGGWSTDFARRDPFAHPTVITAAGKKQGKTGKVFHYESPNRKAIVLVLDGFCIDRGPANYYYGAGEPGANKDVAGHVKDSCWGYRQLNRKKSGSDPVVQLFGCGTITVRNLVLVNCPWWGIYVKGGGKKEITIENNLILGSQGRGIEAITGGGWGTPKWVIRHNTVLFNHAIKTTEGRALSIDPRKGYGTYTVENNVFAFSDGAGVAVKFNPAAEALTLNHNLFYFNRRGDFAVGGTAVCRADDFEDELECTAEGNRRALPASLAKVDKGWFDRYSAREFVDMLAGDYNTWEELKKARAALGLQAYRLPGYKQTFPTYAALPQRRNNYDMSRYPHPLKKGALMNWTRAVLPLVGADGEQGIRPESTAGLAGPPK